MDNDGNGRLAQRAVTKAHPTADRSERDRARAVAEAIASEQAERGQRPGIFALVDPPPSDPRLAPSPGSVGPGANRGTPETQTQAQSDSWLQRAQAIVDKRIEEDCPNGTPNSDDGVCWGKTDKGLSNADVGRLFGMSNWDLLNIAASCIRKDVMTQGCKDEVISSLDLDFQNVVGADEFAVSKVLEWAGAVDVRECGKSSSGSSVFCVAASRMPSMNSNSAVTIGHFIFYNATADNPRGWEFPTEFSFSDEDPFVHLHEMAHVDQGEMWGTKFLEIYVQNSGYVECLADKAAGTDEGDHKDETC